MTPLRALSITALFLAAHALLVPAGLSWDVGKTICERGERRVGADVTQRVLTADGRLLAPEVSYRAASGCHRFSRVDAEAFDLRPTGHWRVVDLPEHRRPRYKLPQLIRTTVGERCEPPAERLPAPHPGYAVDAENSRWLGCVETQRQEDYYLYALAAAPVDAVVDPVLTAMTVPIVLWTGIYLISLSALSAF